jgi:hypothetical protein
MCRSFRGGSDGLRWFKAAFFIFGPAGALFAKGLEFGPKSGSWHPKVNDFGISAPLFVMAAMGFGLVQGSFLNLGRPRSLFGLA